MRERSIPARLWYNFCWVPCWLVAKVWFRFRSQRGDLVPREGPLLVVANHESHLDPVLIGIASPRQLRFLARHTLFFWPLGWLIRSLGAVPIDRASGIGGIKATLGLLKDGEAVVLFPEGTRTKDGRLQPLLPGFTALARRSGATLLPVALEGAFAAMPRGSVFPRPRKISLRFLEPITASEYEALSDVELAEILGARLQEALHGGVGPMAESANRN